MQYLEEAKLLKYYWKPGLFCKYYEGTVTLLIAMFIANNEQIALLPSAYWQYAILRQFTFDKLR